MAGRPGTLTVDADLRMDLNGHPAHLTGSGQDLRIDTDVPAELWAEISRAELPAGLGRINGPRAIGRAATEMARHGVSVSIVGPTGELVRVGARVSSRLGRLTTGSTAVRFGSARTVAPTALAVVRDGVRSVIARVRPRRRH